MTKDEALKMAIEALESAEQMSLSEYSRSGDYFEAINACKEALNIANCDLKQPAQEPVAWIVFDVYGNGEYVPNDNNRFFTKQTTAIQKPIPLYTHPNQNEASSLRASAWQGLTDEHLLGQLFGIRFQRHTENLMSNPPQIKYSYTIQESDLIKFARAIEQALKEKNT